jgi:hypothetical protein
MAIHLKPHTREWFAELEKTNPRQAAMTRAIVEAAGHVDVCSICGDEPASDYKLASEQAAPGVLSTLRLCDDCLRIRRGMEGESFVLLTN